MAYTRRRNLQCEGRLRRGTACSRDIGRTIVQLRGPLLVVNRRRATVDRTRNDDLRPSGPSATSRRAAPRQLAGRKAVNTLRPASHRAPEARLPPNPEAIAHPPALL